MSDYRTCWRIALGVARARGAVDADDVAQETLIGLWRAGHVTKPLAVTIACRRVYDQRRRPHHRHETPVDLATDGDNLTPLVPDHADTVRHLPREDTR